MIGKRPNIKEVLNDKDKDMINAYKLVKRTSLPEDDRERKVLFKKLNKFNRFNETLTSYYKGQSPSVTQSKNASNVGKLGQAIVKYCGLFHRKEQGTHIAQSVAILLINQKI
jgi:hypothetical protein